MVLKILLLVVLYFVFKNFFKAVRIIQTHKESPPAGHKNKNKSKDSDIIDADYRVIKD